MSAALPPEIEVEDRWPESYVIRLPQRELGRLKWIGVALLCVGLAVMVCVAVAIVSAVLGVNALFHRHIFGVLFFFGIPTCAGVLPILWGLALLVGRNEISISDGKVRSRDRIGPFFWGKRVEARAISSLTITSIFNVEEPQEVPPWLHAFDALRWSGDTKTGTIAWGYQPELLEPIGLVLAERCDKAAALHDPEVPSQPRKPVVVSSDYNGTLKGRGQFAEDDDDMIHDDEDDDDDEDEVYVDEAIKPDDCDIEVEYFNQDLTITVPPAGLWKGTGGLFLFSLVWNGAMLLFSSLVAFSIVNNPNGNDGGWMVFGIFGLFWGVGILTLMAAINMGWRKAAIAVAGDALMVIQTGPLGTKRKEWLVSDVSEIVAGPSGMKVNNLDVLELQIHAQDQLKFGMLAGRRSADLIWLAHLLRDRVITADAAI